LIGLRGLARAIYENQGRYSDNIGDRLAMAGVFVVHQERSAPMTIIDELLLLDECSETSEWSEQVLYLPMK
jgi:hypothetical protein